MTQPPDQPRPNQNRGGFPLSTPPARSKNWWMSVPGQLAIVVIGVGAFLILLAFAGIIGPHAG